MIATVVEKAASKLKAEEQKNVAKYCGPFAVLFSFNTSNLAPNLLSVLFMVIISNVQLQYV